MLRRVEAASLVLFLAAAADVWFGGLGTRLDAAVGDWVLAHVDASSRATFDDMLSAPGHSEVAIGVMVLAAGLCLALGRWFNAAVLVVGSAVVVLATSGLKMLYARERPLEALDADAFPSGHVTKAVVVWGLSFAMVLDALWHRKRGSLPGLGASPSWYPNMCVAWVLLVAVTAAGRVFSGEHWLTDVVASIALGTAVVCEVLVQHDRLAAAAEPDRPRDPPP